MNKLVDLGDDHLMKNPSWCGLPCFWGSERPEDVGTQESTKTHGDGSITKAEYHVTVEVVHRRYVEIH